MSTLPKMRKFGVDNCLRFLHMGLFVDIAKNLLFGREIPSGGQVSSSSQQVPTYAPRYGYDNLLALTDPTMCVATAYCCVDLLSDSVAQLPLRFDRLKDGVFVEETSGSLNYLLAVQPNPWQSAYDFWKQVVVLLLLRGNAYIVPVYNQVTLEPERLVLTQCVSHDAVSDTYTVSDMEQGVSGVYGEDQIIHIKGLTHRSAKSGVSVVSYARLTLSTASAGDSETMSRFRTGGNVRGIVSNDRNVRGFGEYADKELGKTATNLDERFNTNGEHIVSLPGQVDFKQISMTSADMQFLESRKFTVREICRWFRVPPSFVFDDTSNNYKSAEMANTVLLNNTLNPILRKIELELLRKLVSPSLSRKRRFFFDRKELNACDLSSRVAYQTSTIAAGIYTVNEWRKAENMPSVEGGDKVLVSANLRTLEEILNPINDNQDDGQGKTTQA